MSKCSHEWRHATLSMHQCEKCWALRNGVTVFEPQSLASENLVNCGSCHNFGGCCLAFEKSEAKKEDAQKLCKLAIDKAHELAIERDELRAAQQQGEPVYMVRTHGSCCWEEASGESLEVFEADPGEYEVRKFYTHADPGEVERLRAELAGTIAESERRRNCCADLIAERDTLRAQLADSDQALKESRGNRARLNHRSSWPST